MIPSVTLLVFFFALLLVFIEREVPDSFPEVVAVDDSMPAVRMEWAPLMQELLKLFLRGGLLIARETLGIHEWSHLFLSMLLSLPRLLPLWSSLRLG